MAFHQKTFRKCGSHYSDISALDGVEVKIGQSYQPPRKVALPVGFHLKDPSEILSLTYDFGLETDVIAKAEAIKAEKQQKEAADAQAQQENIEDQPSQPQGTVGQELPNPAYFTDILQPTTVTGHGHNRNNSLGGKNSFDLADFENNTSTPFELVELQTINDFDELKDVLQSVSQPLASEGQARCNVTSGPLTSMTYSVPGSSNSYAAQQNRQVQVPQPSLPQQPFSYLANMNPSGNSQQNSTNLTTTLSKSVPELSSNQLVNVSDIADPSYSGSVSSKTPPSTSGFSCPYSGGGPSVLPTNPYSRHLLPPMGSVLVDIGNTENSPPPLPPKNAGHSTASIGTSNVTTGTEFRPRNSPVMTSRNSPLPPLQNPPPIPPRIKPKGDKPVPKPRNTSSPETQVRHAICDEQVVADSSGISSSTPGLSPAPVPVPRKISAPVPLPRTNKETNKRHSSPLPPIPTTPALPGYESTLPDPMPVLTESEKKFVNYISIMGFPIPRVARAVQRLGEQDREVIDYLVIVDELMQTGHAGDDVEIAMGLNNFDKTKSLEFLELSKTFKELGFKEAHIQEALSAADNDSNKALDFLTSISTS